MKIRNGFVSNSSSSSFLLMVNGTEKQAVTVLKAYLAMPPGHPFESMVEEVIECFVREMKDGYIWDRNEYYDEGEESEGVHQLADEKQKEGWSVYNVSFSNEGEPIEAMLCYMSWDLVSANLIIKGEGGF